MLNPFGKALRKLRIDRGWLLKDMAEGIGVATSFLSGIETGRKAIPAGCAEKIADWAGLAGVARSDLIRAADQSRREYTVRVRPDFTDGDREAAALLARFGDLPREKRDSLHMFLKKAFE